MIELELPSMAGIYLIVAPNGLRYVGSAVNLKRRRQQHLYDLTTGNHSNQRMSRIANKYGVGGFKFSVVELVSDKSSLLAREQFWLDSTCPDLNILRIAGSGLGVKRSQATRDRMSAVKTGLTHTPESKEKMRAAKLGKTLSAEHRAKIGNAARGKTLRKRTDAENNLNAKRQRKFTDEQAAQMVWLSSLNLSSGEISRAFGVCHSTARRIYRGERRAYK